MEASEYARFLAALLLVLGLIALLAWGLRRFHPLGRSVSSSARRLAVVENLAIDPRCKLVLVRCDGREHLLLLGQNGNRVIESRPADMVAATTSDMGQR